MNAEIFEKKNFHKLFQEGFSFLDVRAPVEFAEGSLPDSINSPLLSDEERKQIGIIYKKEGPTAAIALGHKLVSGKIKEERLQAWLEDLKKNPNRLITCFRGGLRSKTVQEWCFDAGVARPRVEGGYKALRQFLMQAVDDFSSQGSLIVISGATGSAKTKLIRRLQAQKKDVLDLELYAHHRGSAFGSYLEPQPAQATFENRLAAQILKLKNQKNVLIEDESRLIGKSVQPESLFQLLRKSPIVLVEEPIQKRVENTFDDYILNSAINSDEEAKANPIFDRYLTSTKRIEKKLGGLRCQEVMKDIEMSRQDYLRGRGIESNKVWIEKLLHWYYDPLYFGSLQNREPQQLFKGTWQEVYEYLLFVDKARSE